MTDTPPDRDDQFRRDLEKLDDDLRRMERPDRAIALPREEDEHGPGQVTHLVRSAGPVLDLSSDMAVLLEAETVRRKAGSSAP